MRPIIFRTAGPPVFAAIAAVLIAAAALTSAGCNQGLGAFQLGVGSTRNKPPGVAYRILGQFGMPFGAVVSDANSTWIVDGTIPLNIVLINNSTPVRITATKHASNNGILSVQLTAGFVVKGAVSTQAPYGVVTIQSNTFAPGFAPPPPPAPIDIRVVVRGPLGARFSGLVEDSANGFIVQDRAPAVFLFDSPSGPVDATIQQVQNFGPLDVLLMVNGAVVDHKTGFPTVTVKQ